MAYGRIFQITINCSTGDTFTINEGDVDFSCVRDDKPEPNEATLTIWGITADSQNRIAVAGSVVSVAAGYKDEGLLTLFQGEVSSAVTVKPGDVYGLEITLHESLIPYRASATARSFKKDSLLSDAIKLVAQDMGLGVQISKGAAALRLDKNLSAAALSRDVLNSLCKPLNATWSIHYQSILVTAGDSLTAGIASFSPASGLLGVPRLKTYTPKRHKKKTKTKKKTYQFPPPKSQIDYSTGARRQIGVIEGVAFESLLRGGIDVGSEVELSSPSMGQGWRVAITKVSHRLRTRDSGAWTSNFEGVIS
ncbi:hypothetical protein JY462_07735 [Serratia marcescens]|uniref:hypothetical protein n=1 Tax=Serratia marcescens TaxID=615 RepID=UPI000D88D96E|nr:hypothetical protein [Serratia marcescens]MBN5204706.1 hypothetical protein [Serratia marcescens]PYA51141.1 hypothetical protein DMW45_03625 [Serratia marcescens]